MGVRETWIFPSEGGPPYLRGTRPPSHGSVKRGPTILPDLPDFKSPVDGKVYRGRAGMREHNLRNDVVPVADLKGLPYLQTNSDTRSEQEKRRSEAHRKEVIINQVNRHMR